MITWSEIKSKIPRKSGVYLFKDQNDRTIYVGKAIDLYHRVASYFSASQARPGSVKTAILVDKIADVGTVVVESELEALILEANLIKKYLPEFNVSLKDDKDYLYIGITNEELPKIITARKKDLKKVKKYFGPFPSARTIRDTLKMLRRVFPWCAQPPRPGLVRLKSCFYYHLSLCPGPCAGVITQEDYRKIIRRLTLLLEGKKERLLDELFGEMEKLSQAEKFEEAEKIKRMIEGINYITQTNRTKFYLENPNFLAEETKLALKQLQKDLNLSVLAQRIEAYDISNIQGKDATGSLVVLTNGEIDKSQYRRFKIRISDRPNDVGMIKEMIRRRLNHPEWPIPDLVLVDGGRGQARAAQFEILNLSRRRRFEKQFEIPVYGLAKRMEWLYPAEGEVIKLSRRSLSLKLLQKIRDEAHRFAISYHRKLRDIIKYR